MELTLLVVFVGGLILALALSAENPQSTSKIPSWCAGASALAALFEMVITFAGGHLLGGVGNFCLFAGMAALSYALYDSANIEIQRTNPR